MKYLDLAIANESIQQVKIKGKNYSEVAQRIKAFRMVYPQGIIKTYLVSNENGMCIFRTEVLTDEGKLLGTGTAYEREDSSFINQTSYIENCETSSVGRALGMAGFGIDVSVRSAEEMQNAINKQVITQEIANSYKLNIGKYKDKTIKEVFRNDPKYINWLINNTENEQLLEIIRLSTGLVIPTKEEQEKKMQLLNEINKLVREEKLDYDDLHDNYDVKSVNELSIEELEEIINENR